MQDTHKQAEYDDGLGNWEASYNASDSGRVKRKTICALEFETLVQTFDRTEYNYDKDLGVFWPVPVYEARFKKKAKKLVVFDDFGIDSCE